MSSKKTNRRSLASEGKASHRPGRYGSRRRDSQTCAVAKVLSPTQYYNWKSQLLGSADAVFGDRRTKKNGQVAPDPKEQELTKLRGVIAEITGRESGA